MDDPGKILTEARNAAKQKNHSEALTKYEYFFDHSMDKKDSSYYGVRLSYCLDEWIDLGEQYPEALEQLINKRSESLQLLNETEDPEKFNDFKSISEYLKMEEETIEVFVQLHTSNPKLAKKCVLFIWDELVEKKQWKVCEAYLGDPGKRLKYTFKKFDQSMEISKENPGYGGEDFNKEIMGWFVTDIGSLLLVLKNCGLLQEFEKTKEAAYEGIKERGHINLVKKIK